MYFYGEVSAKLGTYVLTRIVIRGKFAICFVSKVKFKYSENATKI